MTGKMGKYGVRKGAPRSEERRLYKAVSAVSNSEWWAKTYSQDSRSGIPWDCLLSIVRHDWASDWAFTHYNAS